MFPSYMNLFQWMLFYTLSKAWIIILNGILAFGCSIFLHSQFRKQTTIIHFIYLKNWWFTKYYLFILFSGGQSRAARLGGSAADTSSALEIFNQGLVILDIYGVSKSDIAECKRMLEKNLTKAMVTIQWKDKPSYDSEKGLIKKLGKDRVSWAENINNKHIDVTKIKRTIMFLFWNSLNIAKQPFGTWVLHCVEESWET